MDIWTRLFFCIGLIYCVLQLHEWIIDIRCSTGLLLSCDNVKNIKNYIFFLTSKEYMEEEEEKIFFYCSRFQFFFWIMYPFNLNLIHFLYTYLYLVFPSYRTKYRTIYFVWATFCSLRTLLFCNLFLFNCRPNIMQKSVILTQKNLFDEFNWLKISMQQSG